LMNLGLNGCEGLEEIPDGICKRFSLQDLDLANRKLLKS
jgi:hypothetical protein